MHEVHKGTGSAEKSATVSHYLHIEQEIANVAVFDDVVFSFEH